jgi:hypothetical protein
MMLENRKTGRVRGCLIPLLSVLGFILLCFLFCEGVYLIGHVTTGGGTTISPQTTPTPGSMLIPLIPYIF